MVALLLSSCQTVAIKDETFNVDAGPAGAFTVNFLSAGSKDIPPGQWDQLRLGQYCMDYTAVGDFKRELEDLCSKCGCCTWEVSQAMRAFFYRTEQAQARLKAMGLK